MRSKSLYGGKDLVEYMDVVKFYGVNDVLPVLWEQLDAPSGWNFVDLDNCLAIERCGRY